MSKLIYGVGVNDADYPVAPRDPNGKQQMCPFYKIWKSMLHRCYGKKQLKYNQAYVGCTVDHSWQVFSNFRKWMETKVWQNRELDKDLKCSGNRVYSADTCLFVPKVVNNFFIGCEDPKRGVCWDTAGNRWIARCGTGTRTGRWTRYFKTEAEALTAYRKQKLKLGEQILAKLTESDVAEAFSKRLDQYR